MPSSTIMGEQFSTLIFDVLLNIFFPTEMPILPF
jgi:hypothetical protein